MKQTQTKADAAPAKGQHTPGPWYTRHGQVSSENSAHGCTIANCNRTAKGIPDAEVEANARLIAFAPDLLAALARSARNFADILDNHPAVWPAKGRTWALTPEEWAWREKIAGFKTEARAALARAERGQE